MIFGVISILAGIGFLILTEQARKDSEKLKDTFMSKRGQPLSTFAYPFVGRTEEARQAIIENKTLRQLNLGEKYVVSLMLMVLGIWQLFRF
jgi:hypothetical protein